MRLDKAGDGLTSKIRRFGWTGSAVVLAAATLLACNAIKPVEPSAHPDEPINLTAQTGTQTAGGVRFTVHRLAQGQGVLRLDGRQARVLELKGGSQFSVVPVQLEPDVRQPQFFIATAVQSNPTRPDAVHVGWVVTLENDRWQAVQLPFTSTQPIRPPVDVNKDGRREFVLADAEFSPVAVGDQTVGGPERYFIVKDGRVIEQTGHPDYNPRWRGKYAAAKTACETQKTYRACSAYAAWAAQAGGLDRVWPTVLEMIDTTPVSYCRTGEIIVPCATGQAGGIALAPPEAIQFRLGQAGYIPAVFLHFAGMTDTSFGCKQAATIAERTICADADLSELERRVAAAFGKAMALSADRQSVAEAHMRFLAQRDRTIGAVALTQLYQQRLEALESEG